mgnify:FL=1
MKALRTKISTYAIALLATIGFATSTLAGSSDFSGIWIAGHAEFNVVAIDGTHTTGAQTSGGSEDHDVGPGTIGGFAPTAGYEVGFNMPVGDTFFVTVGYADGGGESAAIAKSKSSDAAGTATTVTLHASNPSWWYIAPSISVFDNSAVYVKIGRADASLKAVGNVTGAPGDITGDMWGIGTTSIADSGLFFKTEAGAIQYDQFKITGIGGKSNVVVEGDPLVGYGHVAIGYKF